MSEKVSNEWDSGSLGTVRFTFEKRSDFKGLAPIMQSYAFCFNEEGKLLLGRNPHSHFGNWIIPGGTVEAGEDPVDTLHRELLEEVDVVAGDFELLGVQEVTFLDVKRNPEYQLRFAVKIKELKSSTPDPDNGEVWERMFIDPDEFTKYVDWGDVGAYVSGLAKEWFEKNYL